MSGVTVGKHMLYDASVVLNGVDVSSRANKVAISVSQESFRADAFGDTQKYDLPALQVIDDVSIDFYQDYGPGKTYATLLALFATPQTTALLVVKPSSAAASATNPAWTIPVFLKKAPVIDGTHGAGHMVSASFGCAGNYSIAVV